MRPPREYRRVRCCVDPNLTVPPVMLIASVELLADPASELKVAVPAVLVKVAPADQVWVPPMVVVPLFVKLPAMLSDPVD